MTASSTRVRRIVFAYIAALLSPLNAPVAGHAAATGSSTTLADRPVYRSAFEGYRRFADEPLTTWRAANDRVGAIGGWQAYAREAQSTAAAEPEPRGDAGPRRAPSASTGDSHGNAGAVSPRPSK